MLELLADDLAGGVVHERLLQHPQPSASATSPNCSSEGIEVEESQKFRLADGPQQAITAQHVGEIDERARHGRDGNAVFDGHVVRIKLPRAMDPKARHAPARPDGHVHSRSSAIVDPPQGSGIEMTEHGALPTCDDGRHPAPLHRQPRIPHGINALVDPVKPTLRRAPSDPAVIDADSSQLPTANNAMLPRCQRTQPDIRVCDENLSLRA